MGKYTQGKFSGIFLRHSTSCVALECLLTLTEVISDKTIEDVFFLILIMRFFHCFEFHTFADFLLVPTYAEMFLKKITL